MTPTPCTLNNAFSMLAASAVNGCSDQSDPMQQHSALPKFRALLALYQYEYSYAFKARLVDVLSLNGLQLLKG